MKKNVPLANMPSPGDELYPKIETRQKPRRRFRVSYLLAFLFLLFLVYLVVQLFLIYSPNLRTEYIIRDSMVDSITVQGFVGINDTPVTGSGGVMYYTIPAGERVTAGGKVAEVYATEAAAEAQEALKQAEAELAQLETATKTMAEGGDLEALLKLKYTAINEMRGIIESGNYADISSPKAEVALASNKVLVITGEEVAFDNRMAELGQQRDSHVSQAVPVSEVAAPASGYFIPSPKYDRILADATALEESSPAGLQQMLEQPATYYSEDVVGHIVQDYKWNFYTVVSLREAARFEEGAKLEIAFPDISEDTLPVTVTGCELDEEAGLAKITLHCEYINTDVLQMRCEKAKIIFRTEQGLRIPKQALRIIEGQNGVYVKFGNMVHFRPIKVVLEDEYYMLTSADWIDDVNEVQMYDDVVVDTGGMVLTDGKIV